MVFVEVGTSPDNLSRPSNPPPADRRPVVRVLVGHGFPNLGGNWVTEAVDAATGAPLAEVGAGLVDGLRGCTLLTRRQRFGTGTPVAISLTVTDLDQPGSGWSGTIGVVAALGGEPIPPPLTLGPNFAFQSGHGTLLEPGGPLTNGNGIRAFAVSGAAACPPPAGTLRCPTGARHWMGPRRCRLCWVRRCTWGRTRGRCMRSIRRRVPSSGRRR